MKKIFLLSIMILFISGNFLVYADYTKNEIRTMMRDQGELDSFKEVVNGAVEGMPSVVRNFIFGSDRLYHVRIGSSNIEAVLENGIITKIRPGRPNSPTHYLDTDYDTVVNLMNSDNPGEYAANAILQGKIIISEASGCSQDIQCDLDQKCVSGECNDVFTVAVVPIAYSSGEYEEFYNKAKPEMELFVNYAPLNNDEIRIHYVDPSICPGYRCDDVCRDCQDTARECAKQAGLLGVADKIVGVSKEDVKVYVGNDQYMLLCGCSGGIPSLTSVSRSRLYVENGVYCYNTVPHELGHQLGLYHVDADGSEAGACLGPNANDCQESDKASDIMGYAWPQNHYGPAALSHLTGEVSQ